LTPVDLQLYAQTIREKLAIDELEPIDFGQVESHTTEIERRRALLRYFVPDVFVPGHYNRREDLIDACIYYLEFLQGRGNQVPILDLWMERLGLIRRFQYEDIEEGSYGFEVYHPIFSTLGNPSNPGLTVPKLVQYIRCFKDRKLKLNINEYTLIFFSIFNSTAPFNIDSKTLQLTQFIQEAIEKPLPNGFDLLNFIRERGFKNARELAAQFNKTGIRTTNVFERSALGLSLFLLQFSFPNHYRIDYKGLNISQNFLTIGRENIQEMMLSLPQEIDRKSIIQNLQKIHPSSQIYRIIKYRIPTRSPLTYFNLKTQDWAIPWDSKVQEWTELLNKDRDESPFEPVYSKITPDAQLVRMMELLEENPIVLNSELSNRTHLPLDKVRSIRQTLDEKVLAYRSLYLYHNDLCAYCILDVLGNERWKYNFLVTLGEIFPIYWILHLENLKDQQKWLRAGYLHVSKHINKFIQLFQDNFNDKFQYKLHLMFRRLSFNTPLQSLFDPETESWKCDLKDYKITPIDFSNGKSSQKHRDV